MKRVFEKLILCGLVNWLDTKKAPHRPYESAEQGK